MKGGTMVQIEVRHEGLKTYRMIRGTDPSAVERRAEAQRDAWDAAWQRLRSREDDRQQRERNAPDKATKIALAAERTAEAEKAIAALDDTLRAGLARSHALDWETLKRSGEYPVPMPKPPEKPVYPSKPDRAFIPPRPEMQEPEYTLADSLLFQKEKKRRAAEAAYRFEHEAWKQLIQEYNDKVEKYNERVTQIKSLNQEVAADYKTRLKEWGAARDRFQDEQRAGNERVDAFKAAYLAREPEAVRDYGERVLLNSEYPDTFPQSFDLDYLPDSRTLVVDYALPTLDHVPTIRAVAYNEPWDIFEETEFPDADRAALYNRLIDQIVLRTLHELFSADSAAALDAVVVNGHVAATDPATGQASRPCVVSVRADKSTFEALDLARVDPRECVQKFEGRGAPPSS